MKLHILSDKMHKNVMLMELLIFELKVIRLDRASYRAPLVCESNALPIWLRRYTAGFVIIELQNPNKAAVELIITPGSSFFLGG